MRKTLLVSLIFILLITMLVGCKNTNGKTEMQEETITESKNDITINSVIDENAPIKIASIEQSGYIRTTDETVMVAYNVKHEKQTKVDEELVKKMSESLKKQYRATFPEHFSDEIKSIEVINIFEYIEEGYTNAQLFLKGKVDDGYFLTMYKMMPNMFSESFESSYIVFVYETDGDSSEIDSILEKYQKPAEKADGWVQVY